MWSIFLLSSRSRTLISFYRPLMRSSKLSSVLFSINAFLALSLISDLLYVCFRLSYLVLAVYTSSRRAVLRLLSSKLFYRASSRSWRYASFSLSRFFTTCLSLPYSSCIMAICCSALCWACVISSLIATWLSKFCLRSVDLLSRRPICGYLIITRILTREVHQLLEIRDLPLNLVNYELMAVITWSFSRFQSLSDQNWQLLFLVHLLSEPCDLRLNEL